MNPYQNNDQWFKARSGIPTASRFVDVLAKGKSQPFGLTAKKYMMEIIAYMLGDQNNYTNQDIERGNEYEQEAIYEYEKRYFKTVDLTGFHLYEGPNKDLFGKIGGSPDGICQDRLIEVKCRRGYKHLEYVKNADSLERKYKIQIQGLLLVTGLKSADYVCYCPYFNDPDKKLIIHTIERNNDIINELTSRLILFNKELDKLKKQLL